MEQVIWVEILSRHRDVVARHRFAAAELRIGRGYDNDLVLDDPHVAVSHLRVFRDAEGALVAEDVGSANGMFLDRERQRRERIVIGGDEVIRIGAMHLRLRDQSYVVPRERAFAHPKRRWPVAAVLAAAILGIEALSLWLADISEPKASRYVMPLLGIGGFALVWTAIWAVVSRVFAGEARFERILTATLAGLLAYTLYSSFAEFAAFSLAWRAPAAFDYVAMWGILGLVAFRHLQGLAPRRRWINAGAMVALVALAIATQTLTQSEARADLGQQSYLHRLLPPSLRLAPVQEETAFFARVEDLKAQLDRDRSEEPAAEAGP